MSIFEISMLVLTLILIVLVFSAVKTLKLVALHLKTLQKTLMNFEKIVFDDNFEIKSELRHINSKDIYDEEFLRNVRNLTIRRE
jgi:hypothetical protein